MRRSGIVLLCFLFAAGPALASGPAAAEIARQTLSEWVQARKLLAAEESGWRQDEAFLRQSIDLLEKEEATLQVRLHELQLADDQAADERRRLSEKNEALLAASREAAGMVAELENDLRDLRPALPQPLLREAAALFSRLDEAVERQVSLSQRLQTVLGLLAEINRFQQNVTLTRETREFENGARREVRAIYLGLALAYFVDDSESVAGTGRPLEDGWVWKRNDEIAPAVGRAVAILENRRPAEFINLPAEVTK
jgi:hypothetical protein